MKDFFKLTTLGVLLMVIVACEGGKKAEEGESSSVQQQYACPMHPQVLKNEMSACSVCGMDLVPFRKSADKALKLNAQQQLLANVSTVVFGKATVGASGEVLNGRLVSDLTKTNVIAARVAGRVEQLLVKEVGLTVKRGQALFRVYSEELAGLQQEYLMALAQQKAFPDAKVEQQLLAAAKQRLRLYGFSEAQLKQLQAGAKKDPVVTVYAEASGVVEELMLTEGQYISAGQSILKLQQYDKLWVEADVYPNQIADLKVGQQLLAKVVGFENEPQKMTVEFINPVVKDGSQLLQIRGSVSNAKLKWQAGLPVQVFMEENKSTAEVASLPIDAVIRDAEGAHVWVKTGAETFEPRRVGVANASAHEVEVVSGLELGEVVVKSGAYLLFSEYSLKRGKHPLK